MSFAQLLKQTVFLIATSMGVVACSGHAENTPQQPAVGTRPVVLDIGHQSTAGGAQTPDGKLNEFAFWSLHAGKLKEAIERAGYPCIILNRGNAPTKGAAAEAAKTAGVVFLNRPDKNAYRYSSTHHPEHIGAGMISADKAIDLKARCVVFLHLNSVGKGWSTTPPTGLIICNRKHGHALAESVCTALRNNLLDKPGGIPNAGKGVKVLPRYIGSQPSAGWMNTLDEEGIPAIVFEAIYTNNRGHVAFIQKDANAEKLAHTIAQGIVHWLKSANAQ